jgi:hypothetical protein
MKRSPEAVKADISLLAANRALTNAMLLAPLQVGPWDEARRLGEHSVPALKEAVVLLQRIERVHSLLVERIDVWREAFRHPVSLDRVRAAAELGFGAVRIVDEFDRPGSHLAQALATVQREPSAIERRGGLGPVSIASLHHLLGNLRVAMLEIRGFGTELYAAAGAWQLEHQEVWLGDAA